MIDAAYLRRRFAYNKRTGELRWKPWGRPQWSTRYAGTIAGTMVKGYLRVSINKRLYNAHAIIWCIVTGIWPEHEIDHRNRKPADNRWCNLREASSRQQKWNSARKRSNKSGAVGVWFCSQRNRWRMSIRMPDRRINRCFVRRADAIKMQRRLASERVE